MVKKLILLIVLVNFWAHAETEKSIFYLSPGIYYNIGISGNENKFGSMLSAYCENIEFLTARISTFTSIGPKNKFGTRIDIGLIPRKNIELLFGRNFHFYQVSSWSGEIMLNDIFNSRPAHVRINVSGLINYFDSKSFTFGLGISTSLSSRKKPTEPVIPDTVVIWKQIIRIDTVKIEVPQSKTNINIDSLLNLLDINAYKSYDTALEDSLINPISAGLIEHHIIYNNTLNYVQLSGDYLLSDSRNNYDFNNGLYYSENPYHDIIPPFFKFVIVTKNKEDKTTIPLIDSLVKHSHIMLNYKIGNKNDYQFSIVKHLDLNSVPNFYSKEPIKIGIILNKNKDKVYLENDLYFHEKESSIKLPLTKIYRYVFSLEDSKITKSDSLMIESIRNNNNLRIFKIKLYGNIYKNIENWNGKEGTILDSLNLNQNLLDSLIKYFKRDSERKLELIYKSK